MNKLYECKNISINVEKYEARYSSIFDDIKSVWQGTPDNPLTFLNNKEVTDPAGVDPRVWEPVWFEQPQGKAIPPAAAGAVQTVSKEPVSLRLK